MLDTVLLCHPSAQTLGSSLSAISSKTFFYASLLAHKQTFLDPSGLCCIAPYTGSNLR
ncbi:hypothetical protein [Wolbachia endosymbiont (group A) of Bibio marci]|uniref:hypothetical protein n=1 Tax=Wolbachia endosymbiont (group A) of Bibio marci TaxID=2953987 RepID=UPI0022320C2A|nr:hypothetical protein [Wolbachia endosymbiont (group A) of Bibio marci]